MTREGSPEGAALLDTYDQDLADDFAMELREMELAALREQADREYAEYQAALAKEGA